MTLADKIWISALIVIYLLGTAVITFFADFDDPVWVTGWGLWQNLAYGSALGFYCLYRVTKYPRLKWVTGFSLILFGWQVSAIFTGLSINNVYAVAVAFGLLAVLCLILSVFIRG